jgi:RNA polymerase sigma-70 factor (ECF subfamily)
MMNSQALSQRTTRKWQETDRSQERYWVEQAQAGDADAFARLYERFVDRVYSYVFFRLMDEEAAEDLTAEVFMKVWLHLPRYRPETSTILAWIYRIAHNAVIDHYRMRKPTLPLDDARMVPDRDPQPDEQSERHFENQEVLQAMECLTRDQRDVLVMRFLDGMETDEIAQRVQKSAGAVRALQMRGLQMLSRMLSE